MQYSNRPLVLFVLSICCFGHAYLSHTSACFAQNDASKNLAIYASKFEPATFDDISNWATPAEVKLLKGTEKQWESIQLKWPTVTVELGISSLVDDETLSDHLQGFNGYVYQRLANSKMDSHVFALITQINRTKHLYTIQADPNVQDEALLTFASKLAASERAIVFESVAVMDSEMRVLLGPDKDQDENAAFPFFESARQRKDRTMKLMADKKLKPLAGLPTIIADEQVQLRDANEVARRAICLCALAAESEADSDFDATAFLKKHGLFNSLSPMEVAFLKNKKRTAQENSSMTWRYEALHVLLWSLGQVDEVGFPDTQSDAKILLKLALDDPQKLLAAPKLRSTAELLDQADVLYRCMWICRDARGQSKPPGGLSTSIVYERLYAINWLVRHGNAEWDNVQTDS